MKRFIYGLVFVMIFGAGFASAQQNPPNPSGDPGDTGMDQGVENDGTNDDPWEDAEKPKAASPTPQATPTAGDANDAQGGPTDGGSQDWGY